MLIYVIRILTVFESHLRFEVELKERFEDVDFHEGIRPELPEDWTHREIAEAVNLSRPFVSDIMRGEKTPSLEYWKTFPRAASQWRY